MSSNIRITKICKFCNKEFEARKTTSQTCSDHCAKMYYKVKMKNEKIETTNVETRKIISSPYEILKVKEFLTVTDAAKLLNSSRQTIYTLINTGRVKATNLMIKKTLIKRSEIDRLF